MPTYRAAIHQIKMDNEGAYRVVLDVPSSEKAAMLELQELTGIVLKTTQDKEVD